MFFFEWGGAIALITIGIVVTFMVYIFFPFRGKVYFPDFSFILILLYKFDWTETSKENISQGWNSARIN